MPSPHRPTHTDPARAPAPKQRVAGSAELAPAHARPRPSVLADLRAATPDQVLHLQRLVGNRALNRAIQRASAAGDEGGAVDESAERAIDSARGGGAPLAASVGATAGRALGADFSRVKVHTDARADALNRQFGALAFTTGGDIFFRQEAYKPGSTTGQRLLAHELTHVVQQGGAGPAQAQTPGQSLQRTAPRVQRVVTGPNGAPIDWTLVSQATPSAEGVMGGVFFLKIGAITHVIKASNNPGTALFAEHVVETIGGAQTGQSQPVQADSDDGRAILKAIADHPPVRKEDEDDAAFGMRQAAFDNKLNLFRAARFLMVQRDLSVDNAQQLGLRKISDKYKDNRKLAEADPKKLDEGAMNQAIADAVDRQIAILENAAAMRRVGRVWVADTLVGNADRFEQMNTGNAFFTAAGQVGAIDTDAVLQKYDAFVAWTKTENAGRYNRIGQAEADLSRDYADFIVSGGRQISDADAAPSSDPQALMDNFDRWFMNFFADKFFSWIEEPVKQALADSGYPKPQGDELSPKWQAVRENIRAGVAEGKAAMGVALSKASFTALKQRFNETVAEYGGDANFDIRGLKTKARYMKGRIGGASHESAFKETLAHVRHEEYGRYRQKMDAIVPIPAGLLAVPARPADMSWAEKTKRKVKWLNPRLSEAEREAGGQAERLKTRAREGGIDEALEAEVGATAGLSGRKADKALFEAKFTRFKRDLSDRTYKLDALAKELRHLSERAQDQDGKTSRRAKKNLAYIKTQFNQGDREKLKQALAGLREAAEDWVQQLPEDRQRAIRDGEELFSEAYTDLTETVREFVA